MPGSLVFWLLIMVMRSNHLTGQTFHAASHRQRGAAMIEILSSLLIPELQFPRDGGPRARTIKGSVGAEQRQANLPCQYMLDRDARGPGARMMATSSGTDAVAKP